jgi:hypothetical protein
MENLKNQLSAIYRAKEQELQAMSDDGKDGLIDFAILDQEIDDVNRALEVINSDKDIDDKLNDLDSVLSETTSNSLYNALHSFLDNVICVETYGTYIEETDTQHIKIVAVTKPFLGAFAADNYEWTMEQFLGEFTWDHTEDIDVLAQEHGALVGVCER